MIPGKGKKAFSGPKPEPGLRSGRCLTVDDDFDINTDFDTVTDPDFDTDGFL